MSASRERIRHLLHDPDAMSSVHDLADIWSSRPGRHETEAYFGLLPCQYRVHLLLNYEGDVGNGGHAQYFMNPVGAYTAETLDALKELGLHDVRKILSTAISVFPGGQVPKDGNERNRLIEGASANVLDTWAQLDKEFYSLGNKYWALIQEYLRDHEAEILERDGDRVG